MDPQKFAEEYHKYIFAVSQKTGEMLSAQLRSLFTAMILFGFAPVLIGRDPAFLKQNKAFMIAAIALGFAGLIVDFMQLFLAQRGANQQILSISEIVGVSIDEGREPTLNESQPASPYGSYTKWLFYGKVLIGALGIIALAIPLVNWLMQQ